MDAFASLVRRGRETSGLSYQRIAELVGRSPATIRDWERGRTTPRDPEVVLAIAAVLGIPEDELLQSAGLERPVVGPTASYSDLAPHPDEEPAETEEASFTADSAEPLASSDEPDTPIDADIPLWVQSIHEDVSQAETTETEAALPEDDEGETEGSAAQQPEPPTHRTAIPPQPAPRPPTAVPSELSYLEDDRELNAYRLRAVITVVVGVVLLVILEWAIHGLGVSLKSALSGVHP